MSTQNIPKAVAYMTGAIGSFSAMAVAGREVSFELDTFEIMMYRSFVGIAWFWHWGGISAHWGKSHGGTWEPILRVIWHILRGRTFGFMRLR